MSEDLLEQLPNTAWWPSIVVVFTVRSEIYQPGVTLISTNSCLLFTKTPFHNSASPLSFVGLSFWEVNVILCVRFSLWITCSKKNKTSKAKGRVKLTHSVQQLHSKLVVFF